MNIALQNISKKLPSHTTLPDRSIILTLDEKRELKRQIEDRYAQIAQIDKVLFEIFSKLKHLDSFGTGKCSFDLLVNQFKDKNILDIVLLKIVSSMFVIPTSGLQLISYENVISYFRGCLTKDDNRNINAPYQDHLMKRLKDHLQKVTFSIDKLARDMRNSDLYATNTLTTTQIYRICTENGLQLDREFLLAILSRLHYVGNGCYNWREFIDMIKDTIRKLGSLEIQTESSTLPVIPPTEPQSLSSVETKETPRIEQKLDIKLPLTFRENPSELPYSSRTPVSNRNFLQKTASSPLPLGASNTWINRFMHMADDLYRRDLNYTGFLPIDQVRNVINNHNELVKEVDGTMKSSLNLSTGDIELALSGAMNVFRDKIDLKRFLHLLTIE